MLKLLAVSLLMLSPSVVLAQDYQAQQYDAQGGGGTADGNGLNGDGTVAGTDGTITYGIPNADGNNLCCGETSPQPGGSNGGDLGQAQGNE